MKHFLILTFCLFAANTKAQNWTDAKVFCSSPKDNIIQMAAGEGGIIYLIGGIDSIKPMTIGNSVLYSKGKYDIYVAAMDSSFNLIWLKQFGAKGHDLVNSIAVDNSGNILICGSFQESINFDSIVLNSYGREDIFITKLDKFGEVIWAKNAGSEIDDACWSVSTDEANNIYISGYVTNNESENKYNVNFDDSIYSNIRSQDAFVAKLSASGKYDWVKIFGSNSSESANCKYSNGLVYVFGAGYSNIIIDSLNLKNKIIKNGWRPGYIACLDTKGNAKWINAFVIDDLGYATVSDVVSDSFGNVWIVGTYINDYSNSVYFGNQKLKEEFQMSHQGVIAKLNYFGEFNNFVTFGGGISDVAEKLVFKNPNQIIVGCVFSGSGLYNNKDSIVSNYTNRNGLIMSIDSDLTLLNYQFFGGSNANYLDDMIYLSETDELIVIGENFGTKMNFGNLQFDNCDDAQIYIAKRDFKPKNVSISDNKKLTVQIFPNPATNSLELVNLGKNAKGSIYSLNGTNRANYIFKDNSTWVDINFLERGMYIFKIDSDNQSYILKFYRL